MVWQVRNDNLQSGVAGADLSSVAVGTLLMLDTTAGRYIVTTANTDIPVGVLWEGATTGRGITFIPLTQGDIVPVVASAAVSLGAKLSPTSNGKVVTDDGGAGDTVCGIAVQATTSGDGDVIGMRVLTYES